jgi:hypothetical protein
MDPATQAAVPPPVELSDASSTRKNALIFSPMKNPPQTLFKAYISVAAAVVIFVLYISIILKVVNYCIGFFAN